MLTDSASLFARVLEFERETVTIVADEVGAIPEGWLARTPSLPEAWFLNGIWVRTPMRYDELVALCHRHRGEASYDQLFVGDDVGGQALVPQFRAAGWRIDVDLHSVLASAPDRGVDTSAVIEPRIEESLALIERWVREDETLPLSRDGVGQLVEANRRIWPLRNARRFGVRGSGGELQGTTALFSDGSSSQVENVYVVPEARGRGYARAMVSAATETAREAGHELTFIVADDEDWPKQLYRKLGFEPVGRAWQLRRKPQ